MTVAAATELWRMSATELAEAIRSGLISRQGVISEDRLGVIIPIDPR